MVGGVSATTDGTGGVGVLDGEERESESSQDARSDDPPAHRHRWMLVRVETCDKSFSVLRSVLRWHGS